MATAKKKPKGKKQLTRSNAPKLPGWRGKRCDGSAMFPGSEICGKNPITGDGGDELEFIKAMDQLKKQKPFPTLRDILSVVKSLGYRRVVQV